MPDALPLDQVDHFQNSFQRDALSAVAAIFCVAFFVLLWLFLNSLKKHAQRIAEVQEQHALTISALHTADRERAVKLEITLHGLLEMIEDFRVISYEFRRKAGAQKPKRKTGEHSPLEGNPAVEPAGDFAEGTLHIDPRSPNPLLAGKKRGQ